MRRTFVALALLLVACKGGDDSARPAVTTTTIPQPPVRVAVWSAPEPAASTFGGAAVRALVYPQLFRATPDGKWQPSLVEPNSDATRPGDASARFRLHRNARWSDGTPITVDDLRRTMDTRFVAAIDDPTPSGTIVVHFMQPLPGWRRLWSGHATISPPKENVFGGPYKVERVTSGFETVLVANDEYWGKRPHVRELHLVLVPHAETQARLMEREEIDVIAPLAFTDRRARLDRIKGARVVAGTRGGWTASLVANPTRLAPAQRQTLFATANAPRFADVLLNGEATSTGERAPQGNTPLRPRPAIVAPLESSASSLLLHGMQRAAHKADNGFDLRQAEYDRVLAAYAASDFDALLYLEPGTPERCWTCSYASVDAALAKDADAHTRGAARALERRLVSDYLMLPLWRERPVAAVRDGLAGVSVNGFHVGGPLWNVETWRWAA